jgi:hypothetical protein
MTYILVMVIPNARVYTTTFKHMVRNAEYI